MSARREHLDGRAIAILLVCCLFWGVQQVMVKATLPELAPVFQAALRFVGATALLWLWCRWRGVPLFQRDGTLGAGLLAGALFAGEFAAMYLGLQYTTASRLTVFLYTSPFWVALVLPWLVPAERLHRLQWLGLACAFAAVLFALREGFAQGGAGPTWRGDLLALAAGALWGLTTVSIRATRLVRVAPEKMLFYRWPSAPWCCRCCRWRWASPGAGAGARLPPARWRCRRWWAPSPATWPGCGCWRITRPRGCRRFPF